MRWHPETGLVFLAVLCVACSAGAQTDNLARGCRVTWDIAPNYAACTDEADAQQLTDGERVGDTRGWVKREMVGWERPMGSRVRLTLDLGRTAQVHEVILSTRQAHVSEVLPPSVLVAVSNDGEHFRWAGALDARAFKEDRREGSRKIDLHVPLHRPAAVRWVLLVLTLQEDFLFFDEIEVHGTPATPALPTASATTAVDSSAVFRTPESDAMAARQRRLWALRRMLPESLATTSCFPQVAIEEEEAARLARRGERWRLQRGDAPGSRFGLRRVDPFEHRTPWSEPGTSVSDTLHVSSGHWAVLACDVWSSEAAALQVTCRARSSSASLRVMLRCVRGIEARDETWTDDALPLYQEPFTLLPGQSRQIWLDVDARHATPGIHTLNVSANARSVEVVVCVHDPPVDGTAPFATFDFTYPTRRELLRPHALAAIRDNQESGINSWLLDETSVPWPRRADIDAAGERHVALDFSTCDAALQQLGPIDSIDQLGWYWNFWIESTDPSGGRFQNAYLSRPWKRAVSQWLQEWLQHLRQAGVSPHQLFMQPMDERGGQRVVQMYRQLKRIAPEVRLAATLSRGQSQRQVDALLPWIDIAILNREIIRRDPHLVERMRARGDQVWVYAVPSPAKSASPLQEYRMLAWEAWALGLQGCSFWSYAHVAGDSWDDFDGDHADFSVVYENRDPATAATEPFVPSKRWRAFRLGMQDVVRFENWAHSTTALRQQVDAAVLDPALRPAILRGSFP